MTTGRKISIRDTIMNKNKIISFKDLFVFLTLVVMFFLGTANIVLADGGAPAGGGQQPGLMGMLFPFLLMFGVIYFLMIRPQQKKMKEHKSLLDSLQHGDEVVTASGMLGKVAGITEKVVTLEVADDVKIRVLKSQIAQIVKGQLFTIR